MRKVSDLNVCSPVTLCVILIAASTSFAAMCDWAPDPKAPQNTYPINKQALVFSHSVPNGKAYRGGQPGFEFYVAHVYGSDYEMGRAHGELFPTEIKQMMSELWTWLEQQIEEYALRALCEHVVKYFFDYMYAFICV